MSSTARLTAACWGDGGLERLLVAGVTVTMVTVGYAYLRTSQDQCLPELLRLLRCQLSDQEAFLEDRGERDVPYEVLLVGQRVDDARIAQREGGRNVLVALLLPGPGSVSHDGLAGESGDDRVPGGLAAVDLHCVPFRT